RLLGVAFVGFSICYRLRPPRCLTFFPYTTLFQSRSDGSLSQGLASEPPFHPEHRHQRQDHHGPEAIVSLGGGSVEEGVSLAQRIDRKSTRLNSSHVKISYAVFCLKKEKKHVIEAD